MADGQMTLPYTYKCMADGHVIHFHQRPFPEFQAVLVILAWSLMSAVFRLSCPPSSLSNKKPYIPSHLLNQSLKLSSYISKYICNK